MLLLKLLVGSEFRFSPFWMKDGIESDCGIESKLRGRRCSSTRGWRVESDRSL